MQDLIADGKYPVKLRFGRSANRLEVLAEAGGREVCKGD